MLEDKVDKQVEDSLPFPIEKSVVVDVDGGELRIGLRPIKESDASELVKLFKENYPDWAYELDRVYEEDWWKAQVDNDGVYAQAVVTSSDRVVGSFIIDKEENNRRIVIGKVTVDLVYRGKGIANYLGLIAISEVAETFPYEIMYSEARTNKPTTQRILYKSGVLPAAILPNKLSVPGKLESAVLMVSPVAGKRAKRRPDLVENLIPFYEIAKETFEGFIDFDDDKYELTEPSYVQSEVMECDIHETKKSRFCEINCHNGVVPTLDSIVKFVSKMEKKGTRSFFTEVSAYNPEEQRIWIDVGFRPVGYCPAWRMADGEREDVVFMFKGELPNVDEIDFATISDWSYHRKPATWFIEPIRNLVDEIYGFK